MSKLITIAIKQQGNNNSFEATRGFINSLETTSSSFIEKILGTKKEILSFETLLIKNGVYNLITLSEDIYIYIESQLKFYFPKITIQKDNDPIQDLKMYATEFALEEKSHYPIQTFENFPSVDPILNSYEDLLSLQSSNDLTLFQLIISKKEDGWQDNIINIVENNNKRHDIFSSESVDKNLTLDKVCYPCFDCSLRVASTTNKNQIKINNLFNNTERQGSNKIVALPKKSLFNNSLDNLLDRANKKTITLNSSEIATLWHI